MTSSYSYNDDIPHTFKLIIYNQCLMYTELIIPPKIKFQNSDILKLLVYGRNTYLFYDSQLNKYIITRTWLSPVVHRLLVGCRLGSNYNYQSASCRVSPLRDQCHGPGKLCSCSRHLYQSLLTDYYCTVIIITIHVCSKSSTVYFRLLSVMFHVFILNQITKHF